MSFFINCLGLTVPIFVLQVYDRVVYHAGLTTLQGLLIGVALALAFDFALRHLRARTLQRVALAVDVELGRALTRKIHALPLRVLESRPTAHWQALLRDLDVVRGTAAGPTALLLADLPFVVVFAAAIFLIAPSLGWIFLGIAAAMALLAWRAGQVLDGRAGEERLSLAQREAFTAELINARATVKALNLAQPLLPAWEERQAAAIEAALARGQRTDDYVNRGLLMGMAASLALTAVGALHIIDNELTVGALVAANILSGRLMSPLNQLLGGWRGIILFRQSAQRLDAVLAEDEERVEDEMPLKPPGGRIGVEQATFRFAAERRPVLENVSLDIAAGGLVAILGRNGCGKSTLAKLMLGLYRPEHGRVLLDGADVAQFSRGQLARWMGYLPQDPLLFSGTLKDNIAWGRPGCSDEEVLAAAERSGAHAMILDLPDGYGTLVGEGGLTLSPGQRQRVALARALVGEPPVLLLDEPSSWLDRQAEEALRFALAEYGRTRTVILITHSPLLLTACRQVIVIEQGRVAANGPAQTVLPGLFPSREAAGAAP